MRRSGVVAPVICSLMTLASVQAGQPRLTPTTSTWPSKTASGKAAATRVTAVRPITEPDTTRANRISAQVHR